jgi:hypothetical protein
MTFNMKAMQAFETSVTVCHAARCNIKKILITRDTALRTSNVAELSSHCQDMMNVTLQLNSQLFFLH